MIRNSQLTLDGNLLSAKFSRSVCRCCLPTSIFAALFAASVATHDTKSKPDQCPEDRRDDGIDPKRPREVPYQEVKSDPLGVLDDEDDKQSNSDERRDRSAAESRAVLGTGTRIRFRHDDPLPDIHHQTERAPCMPSMTRARYPHSSCGVRKLSPA